MVIAIHGDKNCGKDLVGGIIQGFTHGFEKKEIIENAVTNNLWLHNIYDTGYEIVKFASPVNQCYKLLTGVDYTSLQRENKEKHRDTFIGFSNIVKQYFSPEIWAAVTFRNYNNNDWIITDLRFPEELQMIKTNTKDYSLIKVVRPQNEKSTSPADRMLDDCYEFDYILTNDGTPEELVDKVEEMLKVLEIYG